MRIRGAGGRGGYTPAQTPPKFERHIFVERAGMRFFLVHAQLGQQLEYDAGFDFQFPRQLVDSDFGHRKDCLNNSLSYLNL